MKKIELSKVNETIYYDKCKNGLEVYLWVNQHVKEYTGSLSVKYGSIDTKFKTKKGVVEVPNGVAHFLEHINFNEKNGKTAHDYFGKMGTSINAFTTFNYTSYLVYGSNNIMDNINHLLDYVETPVMTKELVNKESGIILEEVRMDKNSPGEMLYFATNNILYHKNKRKNSVAGTEQDVKDITADDLRVVYDNFYHPANMFLIVTGNFNPDELMASIKQNQDAKNYDKYVRPKVIQEKEDLSVVNNYQEIESNVEIPKVNICYKMKRSDFANIDDQNLNLYIRIILVANFGPTSYFRERLFANGLITALGCSGDIVDDFYIIKVFCETKNPNKLIDLIKNKMKNLSINKKALLRYSKCFTAQYITGFDDAEYVNSCIQDCLLTYKKVIPNYLDIYKMLNIDMANYVLQNINVDNVAALVQLPKKNTSSN